MITHAPTEADAQLVLEHCGPRRLPGVAGKPINDVARAWMEGLLAHERGAEGIALAIMTVWYCLELNGKPPAVDNERVMALVGLYGDNEEELRTQIEALLKGDA